MYNVGECPSALTKSSLDSNPYGNNIEEYCGQKSSSFFYRGECDTNNQNCLDNIYSQKGPYAYDYIETVEYLINRYNKDFAKSIDGEKISKSYFESKTEVREGSKQSIENIIIISVLLNIYPPHQLILI